MLFSRWFDLVRERLNAVRRRRFPTKRRNAVSGTSLHLGCSRMIGVGLSSLNAHAECLEDRALLSVTIVLSDINAGNGDSNPISLMNVNSTLFFSASDGGNDYELWKSDGTTATRVADINPSGDSNPRYLTNVNGALLVADVNLFDRRDLQAVACLMLVA